MEATIKQWMTKIRRQLEKLQKAGVRPEVEIKVYIRSPNPKYIQKSKATMRPWI